MKLTAQNFFSHLIFHPFDANAKKEKAFALTASIACGIFTIGICHAVCAIRNRVVTHRKPETPTSQTPVNSQDPTDGKVQEIKTSIIQPSPKEPEVSQEEVAFIEKIKENPKIIKNMKYLKDTINSLFSEKYDGLPKGNRTGLKFYDMYEFSGTSQQNWKIKLHLDHQYKEDIFDRKEEDKTLNLIKDYLTCAFKENISSIAIKDKAIEIEWKNLPQENPESL